MYPSKVMNSRERTFTALEHTEGDRIPIDFWSTAGLRGTIESELGISYGAFLDEAGVDLRYIEGPAYVGPPLERGEEGASVDIWGVPRRQIALRTPHGVERYWEVTASPLAAATTVAEIEAYPHWPSPDWFDYSVIEAQCDALLGEDRIVVFMGDRLNRIAQLKPAMYLRGMQEVFMDMAIDPDVARAVFARLTGFYGEYLRRILEAAKGKIDIILTGDDFGGQEKTLISREMWNGFLRDGFAGYMGIIRGFGAKSMHHTCGSVVDIIPDMIECGLDILQSVQPEAAGMEPEALKERFGDALSFQGGVSVQKTMTFGTPDDIRREVKHLAETLGRNGGYIFCTAHNIQADAPIENVRALMAAYREFGKY